MRFVLLGLAFLVLFAGREASAQGFISPFVGTTLTAPTETGSRTKPGYGVAFGTLGKVVGGEAEIAFFPEIIDNSANAIAKNRAVMFSGDTLIGPTLGRAKPYVALGAGNLHLNVTSLSSVVVPNPESISNNYFTVNVGAGVMGFFTNHLGVRGDLRYYRAFGIKVDDLAEAGLRLEHFNFWRASFGLAAKF